MTYNSYVYILIVAVLGVAVLALLLWLLFGKGRS